MLKKLGFQKGLKNINIDAYSHIKIKKTNMSFVVLRPNDLAQMGDLIGQGNKDIITWIGKTVGRNIAEVVDQVESPKNHQEFLQIACKNLENLGFGTISIMEYNEGSNVSIKVDKPLYEDLDENQDIISTIYQGVFLGIFEFLGYTTTGLDEDSAWKNTNIDYSLFKFTFGEAVA